MLKRWQASLTRRYSTGTVVRAGGVGLGFDIRFRGEGFLRTLRGERAPIASGSYVLPGLAASRSDRKPVVCLSDFKNRPQQ